MKALLSILAALAVMALAFWAYRENYATQAALADVARLEADIAEAREALSVLNAEWAYLNRPDRLADLAELNFDRLGLLPFRPEQFGSVGEVAYPRPFAALDENAPIDISNGEEARP
jgi:hypothetical protein